MNKRRPIAGSEALSISAAGLKVVRIKLLGGFWVSVGSRKTLEQSEWHLKKTASLIKLLALAPAHRLHREQVMEFLWPGSGRSAASNNLRRILHAARKVLDPVEGSRYLASEGEQLVLCPWSELWVDVEAFEEAASTAHRSGDPAAYRAALDLYAGDLLPADRYERWAEERRERLRRLYLDLLVELARAYEERGDFERAVGTLRGAVAKEPTLEEAHAGLMRLYALLGREGEALTQYQRLQEILSKHLGTEPSTTIRSLHDDIATGTFSRTPPDGLPPNEPLAVVDNHNLPAQRTSFVGREREMIEVKRILSLTRLLTLTGAGGSGKTRLALELARDLIGAYPDGVWLAELANLSDGELVAAVVAEALGVKEQPEILLTDAIIDTIREKRILLVLDNCEHLVDTVADVAGLILSCCPRLKILATSQELLGVVGEADWQVSPLSVPGVDHLPGPENLAHYESVRLFVDRVRLRLPVFELTSENAGAVGEVCRKLEGIPLAVELAAARMDILTAEQIAERLDRALGLLTGGSWAVDPRHRTLRAALDWSYELLSEPERELFRRLSVFAGDFTLEAVEAVGAGEGIDESSELESFLMLVDRSLVVVRPDGKSGFRYGMLEPIRQYAAEKLQESGEAGIVRDRHLRFYLALAEEAEPELRGTRQGAWLERLEREHDNLRAALARALERERTDLGLRLAAALEWFWSGSGQFGEGAGWLKRALAGGSAAAEIQAKALSSLGRILRQQGDLGRAEPYYEEALKLYEGLGDRGHIAELRASLGWLALSQGDTVRATASFEESLRAARASGNRKPITWALNGLAVMAFEEGDFERAQRLWGEALGLHRELGDAVGSLDILVNMGYAELARGNHERAKVLAEESLALSRELGNKWVMASSLLGLGIAAMLKGEPNRAKVLIKESLTNSLELGVKSEIAEGLEGLAGATGALGADLRAARLWGAASALREAIGVSWGLAERMVHGPPLAAVRARLDEAVWETAFAEGKAMGLEEAVEYALSEEDVISDADPTAPEQPSVGPQPPNLTRREKEIALLVAQGLPNRRIAEDLVVSERTVENHVSNILKKLGFRSRGQISSYLDDS